MTSRSDAGPGLFKAPDHSIHRASLLADQLSAFIWTALIVATTVAMLVNQLGISIAWLDDVLLCSAKIRSRLA